MRDFFRVNLAIKHSVTLSHALYLTVARYSYQGLIQELKTPEAAFNYISNLLMMLEGRINDVQFEMDKAMSSETEGE